MKKLRKGSFVRGAATLAMGTAIGQVVVLLAAPLMTRLYTPMELGALAVYAAILSTLVVIASLRYQLAIPLPKEESAAHHLLLLSLLIAIGVSVLTMGALFASKGAVASWTKSPAFERHFWMLPLSLLAASFYQSLNYWAIRNETFSLLAKTKVTQSAGMVGAQLGLGWAGAGPAGLFLGDAIGRAAGSGSLFLSVLRAKTVPAR